MSYETYTKKEAEALGIIGFDGLGFINPKSAFKKINKQILDLIKAGNLVYRKPWRDGYKIKGVTYGPQNYVSHNPYRGYNAWLISFMNATSGERNESFLTAKQIRDRGGKLKKNATPYPVHAFIKGEKEEKNKKTGEKELFTYTGWVEYIVYPIDHTEGVKPIIRKTAKAEEPIEIIVDAETIISNMPKAPSVRHGGDKAFYVPSSDYVQMPQQKAFKNIKQYYSTLFHELTHSTGHSKRLKRGNDTRKRDGSVEDKKAYAFEELVAELGAAYLCGVCEIDYYTMNDTAAYLKGWASVLSTNLSKDHSFLFRAVYAASKAAKYIIGETLERANNKKTAKKEVEHRIVELKKNKNIKASVAEAIKQLIGNVSKYKSFSPMALQMLYTKYKDIQGEEIEGETIKKVYISEDRGLTTSMFKLLEKYFLVNQDYATDEYVLTESGQEMIDSINARLTTLKAKKSGSDLFPELSGPQKNSVTHFIREYVKLHNTIVTYDQAEQLLEQLQKAIEAKEIRKDHPFAKDIDRVQSNLLKLCKHTATNGDTQVIINHFGLKRYSEILGGELNGFMIPFIAAAAGKVIEIFVEKKFGTHHEVKGLNGIDLSHDEVSKGIKALELVVKNESDYHNAFKREKDNIGMISLVYGKKGKALKEKYIGGSGIAKIIDKRNWEATKIKKLKTQDGRLVAKKLIDVLVHGEVARIEEGTKRIFIQKDGYEAVLSLDFKGEQVNWLLTGYKIIRGLGSKDMPYSSSHTTNLRTVQGWYANLKTSNTKIQKTGQKSNPTLNGIEMPGFIRADHKPTEKAEGVFRLPGEIGKFLQDLQFYKGMIVLTGDPHAGKTEVGYQIADAFATMGEDIAIFSLEQGGLESKDTTAAIQRNIAPGNKKHLHITDEAIKGLESVKDAAKHFRVILIDSFQKLNAPSTMLDSLRHEFPNVFFIVIFQQNGEGGTRGGVSADYDTPIKIKVHKVDPTTFKYNYAELVKNRGNSLNVKYMLATKKTVPAIEPVVEKKVKK